MGQPGGPVDEEAAGAVGGAVILATTSGSGAAGLRGWKPARG